MLKDASVISFIIVLIIHLFRNNTVSLFETFIRLNTKSGTNKILPHRTKRGVTLSNRKSNYFALIWYQLILFEQISSYLEKLFSACTIFLIQTVTSRL